jgi:small subunit ribosomal protein S17
MKKEKDTICNDVNCPTHGSLSRRGRTLKGVVISTKMHKTAIIEFDRRFYLPKFERYEKRRTKIKVHNPPCINAQDGDLVKIQECRPLSKTKHFVIVEKIGKERGFTEKREALEEAKVKKVEKKEEEPVVEKKESVEKEEKVIEEPKEEVKEENKNEIN